MTRFVEMIRVSTKAQSDKDTPEAQRRALDRLRSIRPGVLVERIEAPGVSGALSVAERPDLQRLARLSTAHAYDELRVYAIDRLTRADDLRERAAIWGMVADAGAVLVDEGGRVLDPADESGIGEIDYYLQTMFAAKERKRILARTMAGRKRIASLGQMPGGAPPYARIYSHATGWTINEDEVATVHRAVELYLSGLSLRAVGAALASEGRPTRKGGQWSAEAVSRVLTDPSLLGEWQAWGESIKMPAIIDAETAARVRDRIDSSRNGSYSRGQHFAMLRGLLSCGVCGAAIHVRPADKGRYLYYQCHAGASVHRSKCIRVERIDEAVREQLAALLTERGALERAAEASDEPAPDGRADAERELAKCERAEADLLRLVSEGLIEFAAARKRIEEVRARKSAARAAISAAPAEPARWSEMRRALQQVVARATPAEWADLARRLFPRRPPVGLILYSDRVEGRGLSLSSAASSSVGRKGQVFRVCFRLVA